MSKTDIASLRNARWDHLEQGVVFRIRLLKGIAQDSILPAMGSLAEFCQSVDIGEKAKVEVMT